MDKVARGQIVLNSVKAFYNKNKYPIILVAIIFLQCLVIIYWAKQKNIGFVDEYFTLEGAAQGGATMQYWDTHGEFYGNEHNREEFYEFLTTHEEDLLIRQGVSEVVNAFVNRNFYYSCVNLAFSLLPGVLTKWVGIMMNVLLFWGIQGLLYKICTVLADKQTGLLVIVIYGFSAGAISMVTYIRCYLMLAFFSLLVFGIQLYYVRCTTYLKRIVCILTNLVLFAIGYKIHQFGVVLYGLIIFFSLAFLFLKGQKSKFIWMVLGYVIPIMIILPRFVELVRGFLFGGEGTVFIRSLSNMNMEQFTRNWDIDLNWIINHLFANKSIVWILFIFLFLIWQKGKDKRTCLKAKTDNFEWLVWIPTLLCYFLFLVIGGAVAWRYVSPIYPFVVLCIVFAFKKINGTIDLKDFNTILFVGIFIVCSVTSWNDEHISDLYLDKDELQYQVNEKYKDVNGIMIHHGLSQNWLYEAASYWPEGSNVLVTTQAELYDGSFDYERDDEKILLWLSIDYDNEEIIDLFKECTDYQKIRGAFTTDALRVYECMK